MGLPEEFWQARPSLCVVQQTARALLASPDATLAVCLARVVTQISPHVVLPPFIGGVASLNAFYGLVGQSGAGKNAAMNAAAAAVPLGDPDPVKVESLGSGERLASLFMRRIPLKDGGGVEQHNDTILLDVGEIDSLTALTTRNGATLAPELRKLWNGERIGFGYVDPEKRLPVPAHRYRACMVAGIQPGRGAALLGDSEGGTPQRFAFLSANDPDAPDRSPALPRAPLWGAPGMTYGVNGHPGAARPRIILDATQRVWDEVRAERLAQLRDEASGSAKSLGSHRTLVRLKVAAALAFLDGHAGIRDSDWELSGVLMVESDRVRAAMVEHLTEQQRALNDARGIADGRRAVITDSALTNSRVQQLRRRVLRHVEQHNHGDNRQSCTRRCFVLMTGVSTRELIPDALAGLVESGALVITMDGWALP